MMRHILILFIVTGVLLNACKNDPHHQRQAASVISLQADTHTDIDSSVYESENLVIQKISDHVYQHTSFLDSESFGRVPCNGMVVVHDSEAIVFDTPADDESSQELITYFTEKMTCKITAVIATHFHADCVGGLKTFHAYHIPSYANNQTIALLNSKNSEFDRPRQGFDDILALEAGDKKVYAEFFGVGHTKDNIIGYFPEDKVIFGGCLIKAEGASKGNLEDANVNVWSETVRKIKQKYPQTKIVIPGHGKSGGTALLDYTIKLFE